MKRLPVATAAAIVLLGLGACGNDKPAPGVPALPGGSAGTAPAAGSHDNPNDNPNGVAGDGSAARRARLHAAGECIRRHGAPAYQDPLLTADGYVYTDEVALREFDGPQLDAITTACRPQIEAAHFSIRDQGPPPPKLIEAGVRSAQCMRAHGLPGVKDPTADTPFSPGRGFGLQPGAVPGGKQNPALGRAVRACRSVLDEEARQSSLGSLGHA